MAFTDNGERIGRIGSPPIARFMVFDADVLPGWTGAVRVTDHLGNVTHHVGRSIGVVIRQEPVYVEPE